ncbi:MAG TPA: MaoC family dehydratase [Ramlibacter sp.]|nr:MaoC family dehydratase [Ramlibacter sp.]
MTALLQRLQPGEVLHGPARRMTLARVLALSGGPLDKPGWPDRNLHTDHAAAVAAGLDGIVVSGTQWEGHLAGFLVDIFGRHWFGGGEFKVKVPRSVRLDDTLQPVVRCEDVEHTAGAALYQLAVWCENAAGEQVLVGTAQCRVPATTGDA